MSAASGETVSTMTQRSKYKTGPFGNGFGAGREASEYRTHTCTPKGNWDLDRHVRLCDWISIARACEKRWERDDGALPAFYAYGEEGYRKEDWHFVDEDKDGVRWLFPNSPDERQQKLWFQCHDEPPTGSTIGDDPFSDAESDDSDGDDYGDQGKDHDWDKYKEKRLLKKKLKKMFRKSANKP